MSGKVKTHTPTIQAQARPSSGNDKPFIVPAWAPIAIVLVTALVYYRALSGGLTSIDDDFYIPKNPFLRDFSWHGVQEIFTSFYQTNYHPLTTLTYFFEYNWFGLNPFPYHLLNVLLHLLNTWLVWKLAERLSGNRLTALIVCALFALHPMHVESVAWVAERKDVLYTAFYLLALLAYLRYLRTGFNKQAYAGALLLFLASLFSKSAAVTLPVVLVIIDLYKGRKIDTKLIIEKVPFFVLSVLFGILAIRSQRAGGAINDYMISFSFIDKFFVLTSAISFYITKAIAPFGLSVLHYSPYVLGRLEWYHYASLPFLLLVAWMVLRRSALRKELIFGFTFFLAAVSVMLQIIPVGSAYVAERYSYVAYIGLFYIVGQSFSLISGDKWRNIALGLFAVFIITFSIQSWQRIGVWHDDVLLFDDLVTTNPDIYSTYSLRADLRRKQGDITGALEDYTQSLTLNPGLTDNYYKRARIYDEMGNIPLAIADYNKFIEQVPGFAEAYNNRGWNQFRSGNATAAIQDFNKAITINGRYDEAYNNRGWVYLQSGNTSGALADFSKAIELNPRFDKPYYNRVEVRLKSGDMKGVVEDCSVILQMHPGDNKTYYQRAMAYLQLKDTANACSDLRRAMELGNKDAQLVAQQVCK